MNIESKKLIREVVYEVGEYLKDKLPSTPEKPARNSYAHVWHAIKEKFGVSYKDLNDAQVQDVINYVQFLKNNSY